MKKILFSLSFLLITTLMVAQDIKLPAPQKTGGMPLMEALSKRKTDRTFSQKELSLQQLSNLCWAACGVNREDGRMTNPTARNAQEIDMYVFTPKGVYLYDRTNHLLKEVKKGDFRSYGAMQERFQTSPLLLVYVANNEKMKGWDAESIAFYGATDSGNISQNVYLFCAAEGLVTCALGSIYRDKLKELLKFEGKATLGQIVAVPN